MQLHFGSLRVNADSLMGNSRFRGYFHFGRYLYGVIEIHHEFIYGLKSTKSLKNAIRQRWADSSYMIFHCL